MRDVLIEQYQSIHETIKANLATIRQLIRQAESLKRLVAGMENESAKTSITIQIDTLENLINDLIGQTEKLFDQYQSFVNQVFAKK